MSIEYSFRNKKTFSELNKYIDFIEKLHEQNCEKVSELMLELDVKAIPEDLESNVLKTLNECLNKLRWDFKYSEIIIGIETNIGFRFKEGMSIDKIVELYNTGEYDIVNEFQEVISLEDMINIINKK